MLDSNKKTIFDHQVAYPRNYHVIKIWMD